MNKKFNLRTDLLRLLRTRSMDLKSLANVTDRPQARVKEALAELKGRDLIGVDNGVYFATYDHQTDFFRKPKRTRIGA